VSKKDLVKARNGDISVDNVDKTVHNLVFAYDRMWIKLWMKNNVSNRELSCHLLIILMSVQRHLAHHGLLVPAGTVIRPEHLQPLLSLPRM
jgi:hypothetical protein